MACKAWKPSNEQNFWSDWYNMTNPELAHEYNTTLSKVKHYISANKIAFVGKDAVRNSIKSPNGAITDSGSDTDQRVITEKGMEITLKPTTISTVEELLEYTKVDTKIWQVDRFIVNKWDGFIKDKNYEIQKTQLFQIKAYLSKIKNAEMTYGFLNDFKKDLLNYVPQQWPRKSFSNKVKQDGKLLELSISDHHLGKLCWGEEVGVDYDLKIALKLYWEAAEHLIAKCQAYNIEKILFVIGNDFINSDNLDSTTTKGTPQDTDTRHFKLFREARQLLVDVIENLRTIAPVDIMVVPGNHDYETMFYMGEVIEMLYHNADDVNVLNTPKKRKYYKYGRNMLMFTHGDRIKISELDRLMASEEPKMWADTRYREAHIGHFHTKRTMSRMDVNENHGVKTRIMPSLTAPDYWHYENGFSNNIRSSEALIWDKNTGLDAILSYNLE